MTENDVAELLALFHRAPEDIREASEKLEFWRSSCGPVAAEEAERLRIRIIELQALIVSVERSLERLPKYQRDIVRMRCENVVWWKIARKVNYSVRSCQGHYGKALKVLAGSKELAKYAEKKMDGKSGV